MVINAKGLMLVSPELVSEMVWTPYQMLSCPTIPAYSWITCCSSSDLRNYLYSINLVLYIIKAKYCCSTSNNIFISCLPYDFK